jgi:hypothetical protein
MANFFERFLPQNLISEVTGHITPDILRSSRKRGSYLYSVHVDLTGQSEAVYTAAHNTRFYEPAYPPYIHLRTSQKDRAEFEDVQEKVADISGGRVKGEIFEIADNYCVNALIPGSLSNSILVPPEIPLSQHNIADLVEEYESSGFFGHVIIRKIVFDKIPKNVYRGTIQTTPLINGHRRLSSEIIIDHEENPQVKRLK